MSYYDDEGERLHTLYLGSMPEPRKSTVKAQRAAEVADISGRRPNLQLIMVADAAADKWFKKYRGILRDEEDAVEKVICPIRYRHAINGKSAGEFKRELTFFRKHRRRMRYAIYQANYLPIGSSVVESACRFLVSELMKISSRRWEMSGGQAVLPIRALVKSDHFDAAWKAIAVQWKSPVNDNEPDMKQTAQI